jgi:hypothetical protein
MLLPMATAAACTGDDDPVGGAVTAMSSPATTSPTTTAREVVTSSMPELGTSSTGPATVAEEGIPGIDSADPFCRAWSEFAGSFQTLAFASAAESDPLAALRLEVIAAAAVTSAALELDAEFPDSIVSEQDVFIGEVIGPFARRAARAVEELEAAEFATAELDALREAWLDAIADTGVDNPEIIVTLPVDVEAVVGETTATLSATLPAIASDPSLVTQAETPATFGYLADQCPDQGTLAGNDAID